MNKELPVGEARYETENAVLYERRGPIAIISMNRPRYNNAQNNQMTYALDDAFKRASGDDEVAVIIVRGEGKHFSAGHDMGTPGRDSHVPVEDPRSLWYNGVGKPGAEGQYVREQEVYLGMCRRWRTLPKPVIAAVHGACIAGGLMIAWIADIIIAADDAFFSDPVVHMGVPGVEYFAHPFEMNPRIAREFLMLGERMSAQRAYEVGMVNRVVPADRLLEEVLAVAEKLAQKPRFGLTLTKQALNFVEDLLGKRSAMEGAFSLHHLAHMHNLLTTASIAGGQTAESMKSHNSQS